MLDIFENKDSGQAAAVDAELAGGAAPAGSVETPAPEKPYDEACVAGEEEETYVSGAPGKTPEEKLEEAAGHSGIPGELWDRLERSLLNYEEQGQIFEQLIKKQIEVKDELIDKLHRELEYYKKEEGERYRDEVMKSVIRLRQSMSRSMGREGWTKKNADDLRKEYLYVYEDITDLLEQNGIDAYASPEGTDFDPAIHQPRTEPTSDKALDRKVKQSLGDGYMKGERAIIPERVIVYRYME